MKTPDRKTIQQFVNRIITWRPRHRYAQIAYKWSKRLLALLFLLLSFFSSHLTGVFPLPDNIEYSAIITDSKGEVLHAFLTKDEKVAYENRAGRDLTAVTQNHYREEDKYFYRHPGINALAVGRAFVKNIFRWKRTSGASTITMQVRARAGTQRQGPTSIRSLKCSGPCSWNTNTARTRSCNYT